MRIGILGCGRITELHHLPSLQNLDGQAKVVAIADLDEHNRRRVAGMFGIEQVYPNLEAMLSGAEIDAIAICTPAGTHADAVIVALRAGKNVFVEKPLTLSLDDADRIVAEANAHPDLNVAVGFNHRHHRLVGRAKQMIEAGQLGEIQTIRTLWTGSARLGKAGPAWKDRRETGGGTLLDLAIHHVDLIRYLTGSNVENVFAQSQHKVGDDESAVMVMRLTNGASVCSTFSERSVDAHEIEIVGDKGRVTFSLYRFDSFSFTSVGQNPGRVGKMLQLIREMPQVWPILRRGGDFVETYRRQWLAFVDSLQKQKPISLATAEDGREALRVILAAIASTNSGELVNVENAPRKPLAVANRAAVPIETSKTEDESSRPSISAIIATRTHFDSIRRTVGYLRKQTVQNQIELIIVCPDKNLLNFEENDIAGFWGHQVIEVCRLNSIAPANAAGVRAARASIVALCEDHAFPDPQWAQSLIIAHRGGYAAVGPAVRNANPSTSVSWADMIIGYGPWLEPIKPCEPSHLPGHNTSYKRDILLKYGDQLENMLSAESVLQWDLRTNGHRLYLEPAARLAHTNFALMKIFSVAQLQAGRIFGSLRAAGWPIYKRVIYTCASPLIPLVRFTRMWRDARRIRASHPIGLSVWPILIWGLTLDGIGQMIGYAIGGGEGSTVHEFDRIQHITEQDRQQLTEADAVMNSASAVP